MSSSGQENNFVTPNLTIASFQLVQKNDHSFINACKHVPYNEVTESVDRIQRHSGEGLEAHLPLGPLSLSTTAEPEDLVRGCLTL